MLSGSANVLAYRVAWNSAVQSHFSNGSFIGSFAATSPLSLLRTRGESSQTVELGATLVSHMSTKMLRKASGNSLKTMDANVSKLRLGWAIFNKSYHDYRLGYYHDIR